jgi:hypothetical protein
MIRSYIIMAFCILLFGCKKENQPGDSCSVEITHQLMNPYELPEEVLLTGKNPTHKYVKIRIYNISQFRALESQGVFLLDHPFDAIPDKNLQYKTEHTQQYGVYYAVVPAAVNLSGYDTEKISALNMPEHNPTERKSGKSEKRFTGRLTFFDPIDSIQVPLKGVKIIIKDVTKTENAITDSLGNFTLTSSEIISDTVEVLLRFDNDYLEIHTLDVADLLGIFSVNTYSLGYKKSCAFTDLNIEIGRAFNNAALHHSCAALHSLNKYKIFAAAFGYQMPDKKMLFWLGKEAPISTSYAAPMLHNMTQLSVSNPSQLLTNLFGVPAIVSDVLALVIQDQLPDIYAPFYERFATASRASFIETMFHELSHTSHYTKAGPEFWLPYVEYIYGNGGYGTPDLANSGIVGLSEAWAEDLSNICSYYTYGKQKYLDLNEEPIEDWIPYGLYYDLYDTGSNESFDITANITFPQIYSQLTTDTKSLDILKTKLKSTYPTQQSGIENLFNHYGY